MPKTNKDLALWENLGNARTRMTEQERLSTKEIVESISIRNGLRNNIKQSIDNNRKVTTGKHHNEFYHASLGTRAMPHVLKKDEYLDESLLN